MSALYESYKIIEENRDFTVYKHTSPSNKVYIGITCKDPTHRWRNGRGYEKNQYFWNAIQKYGWNNFNHEILFTRLTEKEAKLMEQMYIALYDSNNPNNGYNITLGGEGTLGLKTWKGRNHSKESKLKISKANKKSWDNAERIELQRLKMKKLSKKMWENPEYIKFQSEKSKELWKDPEYRKMMSEKSRKLLNKKWEDPEFRKIRSEKSKKKWEDPEYKEKMRSITNELWESPEYREKMDKVRRELWKDPEYKEKMRNIIKELWKDPEFKNMQIKKASYMLKEFWKDPEYREKMKKVHSKKIILLNTKRVFESITEASKLINTDRSNIVKVCKGKIKYSGKINGEPARWMYYEDYLKTKGDK